MALTRNEYVQALKQTFEKPVKHEWTVSRHRWEDEIDDWEQDTRIKPEDFRLMNIGMFTGSVEL